MQSPDQMKAALDNYPIQCLTVSNLTKSIIGAPTIRNHTHLWRAIWDMLYEQITESVGRSYSDVVSGRRMLFCCFLLTAPDEFLIPFIEEWSNKK